MFFVVIAILQIGINGLLMAAFLAPGASLLLALIGLGGLAAAMFLPTNPVPQRD
jgi:hypothetical protein